MVNSELNLELKDDEVVLLEALLISPAFGALKAALGRYKSQCFSVLLEQTDPIKIARAQGLIKGINVVETLPGFLVQRNLNKKEAVQKSKKYVAPVEPKFDPRSQAV